MKNFIIRILTFFIKYYYLTLNFLKFSNNDLKMSDRYIGKINMRGINNKIILDGRIINAKIKINGNNNTIQICTGNISNLNINVTGNDHRITILPHRGIMSTKILMFGERNIISIAERTGIGGARLVISGNDNYIKIGKNNMISDHVEIWATDSHSILDLSSNEKINFEKPIILKDHVWISSGVKILKGVTLGENSIIGMGSVVVNDVPDNSISAGNPNKTIKNNITWQIDR